MLRLGAAGSRAGRRAGDDDDMIDDGEDVIFDL